MLFKFTEDFSFMDLKSLYYLCAENSVKLSKCITTQFLIYCPKEKREDNYQSLMEDHKKHVDILLNGVERELKKMEDNKYD